MEGRRDKGMKNRGKGKEFIQEVSLLTQYMAQKGPLGVSDDFVTYFPV
jgi:hypothetical protein